MRGDTRTIGKQYSRAEEKALEMVETDVQVAGPEPRHVLDRWRKLPEDVGAEVQGLQETTI